MGVLSPPHTSWAILASAPMWASSFSLCHDRVSTRSFWAHSLDNLRPFTSVHTKLQSHWPFRAQTDNTQPTTGPACLYLRILFPLPQLSVPMPGTSGPNSNASPWKGPSRAS